MASVITKMCDAVSITDDAVLSTHPNPSPWSVALGGTALDSLHPQRVSDEVGAWQVDCSEDPIGTGDINLKGRLDPTASYQIIDTITLTELGTTPFSKLVPDIPLMPDMIIELENESLAVGTIEAWIQE